MPTEHKDVTKQFTKNKSINVCENGSKHTTSRRAIGQTHFLAIVRRLKLPQTSLAIVDSARHATWRTFLTVSRKDRIERDSIQIID
jgi:hypothetical protein